MPVTVDVLCVGSGAGTLAAAVAAARAKMSVLYVEALPGQPPSGKTVFREPSWTDVLCQRWGVDALVPKTRTYLDELTADLGKPALAPPPEPLVITELARPAPSEFSSSGAVPPFYGSNVRTWARQCIHSTTGVVSTRVSLPGAIKVKTASREAIELHEVAALPGNGLGEFELHAWLLNCAREHEVQIVTGSGLSQLLFEEGQVVGGIIDTPSGNRVVNTRHGVMFGTGPSDTPDQGLEPRATLPAGTRLYLSSRRASRFSRLELVRDEDVPPSAGRPSVSLHRPAAAGEPAIPKRNRSIISSGSRSGRGQGRRMERLRNHW